MSTLVHLNWEGGGQNWVKMVHVVVECPLISNILIFLDNNHFNFNAFNSHIMLHNSWYHQFMLNWKEKKILDVGESHRRIHISS